MRRPDCPLIVTVVVGLLLAACASPAGSGEPGALSGSEPSAAPAASQGGGGGGGTGGIGVTLPDGAWTGGDVHVTISGDADVTGDAPLISTQSYTTGDNTVLFYVSADSQLSVGVAIYSDSFAISVTTPDVVAGAGTTMNCDVEYHSAEDNNIDADFSCPNSPSFNTSGAAGGSVNIEGSLTATR
ncbi:MAG TPA: hypothetical protein VMK30_00140 [Pleomorphomonadaceae bacterium]|nr:hypothetical protein [Pleomorphomonadaceae bacterium]